MNVLSLFDGMSCGRIALDRLGVEVDHYYSSEIDKFARKEAAANWPDNIQLGDVNNWREWDIDWSSIDLIMGGSPCQGFSSSGKHGGTKAELNGETFIVSTREHYLELKGKGAVFLSCSHLFWEYVLILDHVKAANPNVKFLLENVKMKQMYLDMITETLSVEPVLINSALVSAQNRQRWYWTNINLKPNTPTFNQWVSDAGLFGRTRQEYDELYPAHISQPNDKGILLKDIIEAEGVGILKNHGKIKEKSDKSNCIDASYFKGIDNHGQRTQIAFAYNRKEGLKHEITKAYSLNASDRRGLNRNQTQNAVVCAAMCDRKNESGKYIQQVEERGDGKTNSLTTVQKDNIVLYPASIIGRRINPETGCRDDYNHDVPLTQCLQVKHTNDKMGCLTTVAKDTLLSELPPGRYVDAYNLGAGKTIVGEHEGNEIYFRKLTVVECCRLQTVPDDYFKVSSNSQAYKMLGNGWTVDVISYLLGHEFKKK